ncbi:uncharacterized protein MONBRDRAFT_36891 [Monosiga brevicollis MX1]|uniref:Endonuclease/exonuclease/phosphatase domain-containing protein n=1 Tax=Monosiga brevicollis TaxID=81824 RepID=A9UXK2_MONBE|nr:uncharacterized protein MONBRDRAFT_36891 [Monosiga brevicollis MX1]EDQ89855.1 predicted protein [Monosiga brevicollis MX1]|eukprot:XP_001745277.1 hypothetical protein [Monosiga brevicollis MX1]
MNDSLRAEPEPSASSSPVTGGDKGVSVVERQWQSVINLGPAETPLHTQQLRLTVAAFNVLADGLDVNGQWSYIDPATVTFERRKDLLLQEIDRIAPDVLGLAECNNFTEFWAPELARRGYHGVFQPKSHGPAARFGAQPDGVALFVRTAAGLELIGEPLRNAMRPVAISALVRAGLTAESTINKSSTPAMTSSPAFLFRVAMTHFKAGKGDSNTALRRQDTQMLLTQLDAAAAAAESEVQATIVMGDFNCEPTEDCHAPWRERGFLCAVEDMPWTTWKFRDTPTEPGTAPPPGTAPLTQPKEKREKIDYIYVLNGPGAQVAVEAFLDVPADADIPRALPAPNYASDHLAVAARLNCFTAPLA